MRIISRSGSLTGLSADLDVRHADKSDQRRKQERQENIRRSLEAEQDTVRGQQESPDFRVVDEETEDEHAMRGGTVGAD